MTRPYSYNPMPVVLDITCPQCRKPARFEHAEARPIARRDNVGHFRKSQDFDVVKAKDASGGIANCAIYWHGLNRQDAATRPGLPEGEKQDGWQHPRGYTPRLDHGVASCTACGLRRKHALAWPKDALYQADYRGHVLWAYNREHAGELLDYIRSTTRNRHDYTFQASLMKVPSVFLSAKAREAVAKKLELLLKSA